MRFILICLVAAVVSQQTMGGGKGAFKQPSMGKAPQEKPPQQVFTSPQGNVQTASPPPVIQPQQNQPVQQPVAFGQETQDVPAAPKLTNAVTDWIHALRLAIDNVNGISNHHHARWLGLLSETIFKALSAKRPNAAITDSVVTSYAAHQFLSYNFPQFQSGYFDVLLNVYLDYYNGTYPYRAQLDKLVLPIVKKQLVRETGSGIVNFVQNYVAPSTVGANRTVLQQYQGKYQFTDVPNDKLSVDYLGKPVKMNWQERGHFGTIKPYFGPLINYVQGLKPIEVGTPAYNNALEESLKYGSSDNKSKDKYSWETPYFWLNDWSHMPVVWTDIARANLDANLSQLETARFFAALGLGIFEAANTCYGMKWGKVSGTSALWRPVTAHRSGDTYGHAATPDWTPQLSTPMHPEYPSGHCAHTSAAIEVIRLVLGKDNVDVVIKSDWSEYNKAAPVIPNRRYTNLTSIERDVANSRVMGGVHWRPSCDDATVLARRAAQAAHSFFYKKK